MRHTLLYLLTLLAWLSAGQASAQHLDLQYTTEMQTDFGRDFNWVNQLRLDFTANLSRHFGVQASTLSMAQTHEGSVLGDWQTFSNLDAGNTPLALAVMGVEWVTGRHSFFAGIRTVPEDYFASPVTGLFVNSSCGIFPTLSAVFPIPNYPYAGMGLHYAYETTRLKAQANLYNGTGSGRITGRRNVFRVCPQSDGLFAIGDVEYRHGDSRYFLGASGVSTFGKVPGEGHEFLSLWTYAEQQLCPDVSLLVSLSHNFNSSAACRDFAGIGAKVDVGKAEMGVFTDLARYEEGNEWATELTCKLPLKLHDRLETYLQPALHVVRNSEMKGVAGMVRFGVAL